MDAQKRLTLEGNIVISVGLFGHSGDDEVWTEGTKEMLDDMHKRKIDSVINEDERPIGFAFGDHKVLFQDGEIKLIHNRRMITQCKVNDFIRHPNAMFRDMMMTMKG